jgi:hypothetical protein
VPSKNYRYFCLDAFGQLHGAKWFYADSDENAVAHVHAMHPDGKCEVWQEQRLVAKLGFHGANDPIVQSLRTIADSERILRETAHLAAPHSRENGGGDAR